MQMPFRNSFFIFLFILVFFSSVPQNTQGQNLNPTINENILKGIDLLYNNQFEQAAELFQKEITAAPDDPSGYFYLAMVSWSRLSYGYWEMKDLTEFNLRIDKCVAIAKEKITRGQADTWTYIYLGGALGYKGRVRLSEENWSASYKLASEAIKSLKTAYAMDPDNKNVLLGLGMFDYYTAKLSGFLKFLTYLFLHHGNREEGLRKLRLAAEESLYSKTEAKSVLLYIYLFMENDAVSALPFAVDLAERYPLNHRYLYLQGLTYVLMHQDEEYDATLKELLSKAENPPADSKALFWEHEALYLEASRLMLRGYPELARKKLDEILLKADPENDPSMAAWPIVKMGMCYDLEKNRSKALLYYNQVMAMANGAGAQFLAKKYINNPLKKGDPFIGF